MSLESRLAALISAIGGDIKTLGTKSSGLSSGMRIGVTADRWYTQQQGGDTALTISGYSINAIRCMPFIPSKNMTLDRLAFNITAAGAGLARAAIYNDNENLYPSSLLVDGGDISTDTAGVKSAIINQPVIGNTLYWLAFRINNTTANLRSVPAANTPPILGYDNTLSAYGAQGYQIFGQIYEAFPNIFPAGASPAGGAGMLPAIFVRGT